MIKSLAALLFAVAVLPAAAQPKAKAPAEPTAAQLSSRRRRFLLTFARRYV